MIQAQLVIRSDKAGDGHFQAARGNRKHKGIDYVSAPGSIILAPCDGPMSKIGYPYGTGYGGATPKGDEDIYRYVEIIDRLGQRHRVFYIDPFPTDKVNKGDPIGIAMDISLRYPSKRKPMTPHVHYEVLLPTDEPVDPETASRFL